MSIRASWFTAARLTLGIEISTAHVAAVRLGGGDGAPVVSASGIEALPPGAVVAALNAPNIADAGALTAAVARVLERVGGRQRRAALVLPDTVAKVSLLRFEKVPPREQDLLELVRWQVRKSVPFPIEDAQISCTPGIETAQGREFLVLVARRDIVAAYEDACRAAGVHAGIVDIATSTLLNALLAGGRHVGQDWLLVNLAPDYLSVAIVRGAHMVFYRHRGAEDDTTLADVVHQTAMYYEDRLGGGGFTRVVVAGAARPDGGPVALEGVRRELEARLHARVEAFDRLDPALPVTWEGDRAGGRLQVLGPALGIVLRERAS